MTKMLAKLVMNQPKRTQEKKVSKRKKATLRALRSSQRRKSSQRNESDDEHGVSTIGHPIAFGVDRYSSSYLNAHCRYSTL
jgi:hypothetical protein